MSREDRKEYARNYYQMNKKRYQEYYEKNIEEILQRTRQEYLNNKEYYKNKSKAYYEKNKDEIKERKSDRYRSNIEQFRNYHREYNKFTKYRILDYNREEITPLFSVKMNPVLDFD
jgi:hypothetical protein